MLLYVCFSPPGLYLVGEKGDKGVAGSPGVCDCNTYGGNTPVGVNTPHYGSYTQRGNFHKVPVVKLSLSLTHTLIYTGPVPINFDHEKKCIVKV